MPKCIICGGRDFAIQRFSPNVAEKLESGLRAIFTVERVDEEVCGMARGADEYGASFAKQLGIPVKEFPAYWDNTTPSPTEPVSIGINKHGDKYNKIAGINRNRRMAEYASSFPNGVVVALPGGSGTPNMINVGYKHGLKVYKFNPDTSEFELFKHSKSDAMIMAMSK